MWVVLVDGCHDPTRVQWGVEEVGVDEGQVACTGRDQLIHVGHDCCLVDGTYPAVVNNRHRTVPAAVRTASTGLDGPDQSFFALDRQPGVPIEGRQQVAGGHRRPEPGQLERRARVPTIGPRHQPRFVLTGNDCVGGRPDGETPAHLCIQPVEAPRKLGPPGSDRLGYAEGKAHRGVHRHGKRDTVGPIDVGHIERIDSDIDTSDFVADGQQRRGGPG